MKSIRFYQSIKLSRHTSVPRHTIWETLVYIHGRSTRRYQLRNRWRVSISNLV